MTVALAAEGVGKRYGRRWALCDCTFVVPGGSVVGVVGANGAGKTTLLHLAVGLLRPTAGSITVLGASPAAGPRQLARVGFVAQDVPLYRPLTVADHLQLGRRLNRVWDRTLAHARLERLDIDLSQQVGQLSGGQRAQVALTLAVAKRPEILFLDEPVASLDPLARREFLQSLMESVAEQDLTVLLSSHLLADVERVCDHVVVIAKGRVRLAGDVDDLLGAHRVLTGPRDQLEPAAQRFDVVRADHTERQSSLLLRCKDLRYDAGWTVSEVGLEELVLAYMDPTDGRADR